MQNTAGGFHKDISYLSLYNAGDLRTKLLGTPINYLITWVTCLRKCSFWFSQINMSLKFVQMCIIFLIFCVGLPFYCIFLKEINGKELKAKAVPPLKMRGSTNGNKTKLKLKKK